MNVGKCPKCDNRLTKLLFEEIIIEERPRRRDLKGFSYICPKCNSIISTQVNPFTLSADLLNDLKRILRLR